MSASCHLWPSFASIATDLPLIILGSEHCLFLKGKWQQVWHWQSGLVLWNTLNYYRDLICWISVLRWKDFMYFQHGNRGPHLPPNKSAPSYYLIHYRLRKIAGRCHHLARKIRNYTSKPAAETVKANNFQTMCQQKYFSVVLPLSQSLQCVLSGAEGDTNSLVCVCVKEVQQPFQGNS